MSEGRLEKALPAGLELCGPATVQFSGGNHTVAGCAVHIVHRFLLIAPTCVNQFPNSGDL